MSNLKLIRKVKTREELMNALATGDRVTIVPSHPTLGLDHFMKLIGHVHSVEREDGSGYSFNVVIYVNNSRMEKTIMATGVTYTPSHILKTVYISFPRPTSRPVRQTPKESPKPRPRTRLGA